MWVSVAAMEGSSSGGGSGVGVGLGARPASLDPRASLYALRSAVEMLQSGQSIGESWWRCDGVVQCMTAMLEVFDDRDVWCAHKCWAIKHTFL